MMEETYKDWNIKLDEKVDVFVATKDEHSLQSKSLKELKSKIDKFKFKRMPVYYKYGNTIEAGEITSIMENANKGMYSWSRLQIWVTYGEKNHRTKTNIDHLYKQSEHNKKLFEQFQELSKKKTELEKQMDEITEKLQDPLTRMDIGVSEEKK